MRDIIESNFGRKLHKLEGTLLDYVASVQDFIVSNRANMALKAVLNHMETSSDAVFDIISANQLALSGSEKDAEPANQIPLPSPLPLSHEDEKDAGTDTVSSGVADGVSDPVAASDADTVPATATGADSAAGQDDEKASPTLVVGETVGAVPETADLKIAGLGAPLADGERE
jgi:hypothetical protein